MKYIIFFLIVFLIFLLYANALPMTSVNEPFDSPTNIKTDNAKSSDVVKPGGPPPKIDKKLANKLDYSKGLSNLNIQYHDSPEKIAKDEGISLETSSVSVYDPIKKKVVTINRPAIQSSATYYEPGKYKYGSSTYVPNYTESVLLSATNHYFTAKPPKNPKFVFYDINVAHPELSKYKPGK